MNKRLFALLVVAVSSAMLLMADEETVDGYTWTYGIYGDEARIDSVTPEPTGAVTIPSMLGGKPVTCIGDSAFSGCTNMTSVTIPTGVTGIDDSAFRGCCGLTSVTIPASVTTIGDGAFDGCSALADVYYSGSEADWGNIYIGINNAPLSSAAIHYNSTEPGGETPLPGDVSGDGKVTAADAAALFAALCDPTAAKDPAVMDLNNDGKVNNRDAILLFRKAARGG